MKYQGMAINGCPDETQRRCYDCKHCIGYISWWCESKEAVELRGTNLTGMRNCPFWEGIPLKSEIEDNRTWFQKIIGKDTRYDGYIEIDCSSK